MQRRTVLRSAVKLAYATPVIALSIHAATEPVGAISEQQCVDPCYRFIDFAACCQPIPGCVPTRIPDNVCCDPLPECLETP